jgi:hypothetical protein
LYRARFLPRRGCDGRYSFTEFMFPTKKTNFRKKPSCPLSGELLSFQKGESGPREQEKITIHLRFCEFCAAEADLYKRYPQAEVPVESPQIPEPLYELANALLRNQRQDRSIFNELMLDESDMDFGED